MGPRLAALFGDLRAALLGVRFGVQGSGLGIMVSGSGLRDNRVQG